MNYLNTIARAEVILEDRNNGHLSGIMSKISLTALDIEAVERLVKNVLQDLRMMEDAIVYATPYLNDLRDSQHLDLYQRADVALELAPLWEEVQKRTRYLEESILVYEEIISYYVSTI